MKKSSDQKNCNIPLQAKAASEAGYKLIVIIDNIEEDLEFIDVKDIYHEARLSIPVIIISPSDGDMLLTYMGDKTNIEVFFPPPNKRKVADIKFWVDTMDWSSYTFLINMKKLFEEIDSSYYHFEAHFPLTNCVSCQNSKYAYPHSDCLGNGRYCSLDPDGYINSHNQQGKDSTREKLRSLCVFKNTDMDRWLDYQIGFASTCMNLASTALTDCAYGVMERIKDLKIEHVTECYKNSFYSIDKSERYVVFDDEKMKNKLLDNELEMWNKSDVLSYPALVINGQPFKGDLNEKEATFEFICQGFLTEPKVCKEWDNWKFGQKPPTYESYKQHFWRYFLHYFFGFAAIFIIIYLILLCYRRKVQQDVSKDLSLQVNSAMSQYWSLSDKSTSKDTEN